MVPFMSALLLLVLLSPLLWGLWKLVRHVEMGFSHKRSIPLSSSTVLCRNCEVVGHPVRLIRGNLHWELLLWLMGLVPGAVYSYWRDNGSPVCSACGGRVLMDLPHSSAG